MSTRCSGFTITAVASLALPVLLSHTADADVKRSSSITESLWGSWAPNVDACNAADKSVITLSAKSYVSSEANCVVDWVSETAGARGPIYSAHLQCTATAEGSPKEMSISTLVLWPKGADEISVGANFDSLKTHLRCAARAPASTR
jgi:hypothetical protein